ncbi:MAG: Asp-tRNA(Asn)/Glu-tRNA(Gln) amidotransferase subunit GatB [Deltaproteobacteria bacterium]|nr:Asp-tRNA(Asn)/Glu-tRNA(Gln) amidotransferase subunit GatB [Deltaproteobacteria bacterium]
MKYEAVIGLEVHAQLKTKQKIFCSCSTLFNKPQNQNTCPVCTGMPGVLPVLNKEAVQRGLKAALALNCKINKKSIFARKNYFYPDLPKGYQISQYNLPLAQDGYLEIESDDNIKKIRIHRLHLEEDAGKNIHCGEESRLNFNRAGVPLAEIVTEPDFRGALEAATYVRELRSILQYLDVCDGNMEEGSLRCDANISLRPKGQKEFGVKTEVKNMNSFKFIERAISYEIERQTEILEEGGRVIQETRLWDSSKGKTLPMRSKEEAHDYRYFPEPDLRPLLVDDVWIEKVKSSIPELHPEKKARFISQYGLPAYDADILTLSKDLADYFESCTKEVQDPKMVSNWMMTELLRELKDKNQSIQNCSVSWNALAELLNLVKKGTISGKVGKDVFKEMMKRGVSASSLIEEQGLKQVDDKEFLVSAIHQVLKENPKELEKYRGGQEKLFGFFVGQVMKLTKGQANPKAVNELLRAKLKE